MVAPTTRHGFTWVLVFVILTCFVIAESKPHQETDAEYQIDGENDGDSVDLILIGNEDDPRGIVMRRWRRFIRNTVFRPGHFIRRAIAAMVIPGTLAGVIAGTVASSIVGVGAGGVTGGIAGAGLGGLGGLLIPTRSLVSKKSHKAKHEKSKESHKGDTKETQDDEDDEDDEAMGRNSPFGESVAAADRTEMLLVLRDAVNVDRLYDLRRKMKLLKIKNKFKTKRRHYIWN